MVGFVEMGRIFRNFYRQLVRGPPKIFSTPVGAKGEFQAAAAEEAAEEEAVEEAAATAAKLSWL